MAAFLSPTGAPALGADATGLDALIAATADVYARGVNPATRKSYARRWALFEHWCRARGLVPLPAAPETAMLYLADAAGTGGNAPALSTLRGWAAAINRVHVEAGHPPPGNDPAMTLFMRSLSRLTAPRTPSRPVSALRIRELRAVARSLDALGPDPTEVRDKALLALHRAGVGDGELARLRWEHVEFLGQRVRLRLASPRPDRHDRWVDVRSRRDRQLCPVAVLAGWRELSDPEVGWVFTLLDRGGRQRTQRWDSRAIRRIRLSRLDSLTRRDQPARVDAATALLGRVPAVVLRDKALLLVGFAGAFRRPDLVGLRWSDLTVSEPGLVVRLRRSKTDRQGHGVDVGIPRGASAYTCPVTAIERWRERCELQLGTDTLHHQPCFPTVGRSGRIATTPLSPEALTRLVRRRVEAAGIPGRWGGRSLRAGFISTAADLDLRLEDIARQSRHATLDSLIRYIRSEDPFRSNPAGQVGY